MIVLYKIYQVFRSINDLHNATIPFKAFYNLYISSMDSVSNQIFHL